MSLQTILENIKSLLDKSPHLPPVTWYSSMSLHLSGVVGTTLYSQTTVCPGPLLPPVKHKT